MLLLPRYSKDCNHAVIATGLKGMSSCCYCHRTQRAVIMPGHAKARFEYLIVVLGRPGAAASWRGVNTAARAPETFYLFPMMLFTNFVCVIFASRGISIIVQCTLNYGTVILLYLKISYDISSYSRSLWGHVGLTMRKVRQHTCCR